MRKIAVLLSLVGTGIGGAIFACGSSDPALPDLPRNDAGTFDVAQGETGSEAGPQNPVNAFCSGTLGVYASLIDKCCVATDKALPEGQSLATHAQTLVAGCVSTLSAGLAKGRIMYQQSQAETCANAYAAKLGDMGLCPTLQLVDPTIEPDPQCAQAFVGLGDKSALCASDIECKDGLTCVGNDSGNDGLCRNPSSAVDGPCGAQRNDGTLGPLVLAMGGSHPACAAGFYCDSTSKCKAQGGPASVCTRNDECTAPERCDGTGHCTAAVDDALVASDGPCKSTIDCQLGLWCDHTDQTDASAPLVIGKCASKLTSSQPCLASEVGECNGVCSTTTHLCIGFCGAN